MFLFSPVLSNTAQEFPIVGGASGSLLIRLAFAQNPASGTVTIEVRKIPSDVWTTVQNGALIQLSTAPVTVMTDGGVSAVRVTFSGLSGGSGAVLGVIDNPTANPSSDLLTDGGFGASRRLRVDNGQTGFFAGKFFRSFIEGLIPTAGPSLQFRFTSPIDFILWSQVLTLTQGALELRVYTGATGSGTWTPVPVIGVNRMASRPQPYYASQITVETGGNFTGGTLVDVVKIRTSAQNATASNIEEQASERGLPAGVYYGRLQTLTGGVTVNDAAQFIYALTWEDRA